MERPRSPGAHLRAQNKLLVKAAQIGHISQAKRAINRGANVNAYIDLKYRDSPLHTAIRNEHVPMVKLLLQAGADPNITDKDMLTPLYWAANRGNISIARLLYQSGADLNAVDKYNRTLLHNAALFGQTKFVKLLLEEYGVAYATAKDRWGDTALHKACQRGHEEVVQYLIQNGSISPMSVNNRNKTPMDEIHPNKSSLLGMFRNISFVRMQPMDIDIQQMEEDIEIEDETSEEEEEVMREESDDDVEMEDFNVEDTDGGSQSNRCCHCCCKSCTVL